ncbi:MAG TPA: hypothetical protein G4N92_05330 [Anaerolineae bacterium]|nr:hypothetical protein [Anaerolineae bacterium]
MDIPTRKLEKAALAIILIGFVIWSAGFIYRSSFIAIDGKRYFCLFDDSMISMRYAWNFSHGSGLVWNPGERIEGYTNLLMTLLMSFATLVFDKSTAALFIQILGVGFMLGIAYTSMRIADHIVQDENYQHKALIRVLSFFFALSYYPLAFWSLMGMETGLLTLLLLLGILSAFNCTRDNNSALLLLVAVCLGLAYLTRNDSIIFAILIWLYITSETSVPKTNRKSLWQLFAAISLFFLFVIGQLVFRYLYYGELLPNTYTLRLTGMPLLARIRDGVGFITPFLIGTTFILVLSCMNLVFDFRKQKLLLLSIVFSAIGYQIYIGGDPWIYWRIMSPSMPLTAILFTCQVRAIVDAITSIRAFSVYFLRNPIFPKKYVAEVLVILLTLIGLIFANKLFLPQISLLVKPYTANDNENNVNTAIAVSDLTTSGATVGVYWAGSIPYFTGRRAIDFLGKSDRYIAHLPPDFNENVSWPRMQSVPGHNKYDLNYSIKTLQPTFVQGFRWGVQDLSEWGNTHYIKVEYYGISLCFLKDSPSVFWSKIYVP